MSILAKKVIPQAQKVWFTDAKMYVLLTDGRELGIPLEWLPRLRDASEHQRMSWRLIGGGVGIHWEELDEDLSIAGLL
jgi:hypothetical protein